MFPSRFFSNFLKGLLKFAAPDIQVIAGTDVGVHSVAETNLYGVNLQVLGNHSQKAFKRKTRLGGPMAAHSTTGRFIGHDSESLVSIIWDMIERRNHTSCIICSYNSKRSISSSIKVNLAFNSGYASILFHTNFKFHVLFVPSPSVEEHFLTAVDHFDRSPCFFRSNSCD